MKRIVFHYPILNMGGAEMSSLRMIKALADRGWDVTMVLTTGGGTLEPRIDPRVKVVRLRPFGFGQRFAAARSLRARLAALPDLAGYGVMRAVGALRTVPFMFRRYDAAAVLAISLPTRFVRRTVHAKVRAHWIRNDFDGHFPRRAKALKQIKADKAEMDHYICVSGVARQSLVKALPELRNKAVVVYNILDAQTMQARAREGGDPFPPRRGDGPRILSVCRLKEHSKGLIRMVSVCKRLVDAGYDFTWYIAGDGPDRERMQAAITEAGLDARMILLGHVPNPYPAYAHADLIAMLSNYEGLCGVINEAKVLGRPIISTEVSGVDEQLTDGVNGRVVANDEDAIFAGMKMLLADSLSVKALENNDYPSAILDDTAKIDHLERLFLGQVDAAETERQNT